MQRAVNISIYPSLLLSLSKHGVVPLDLSPLTFDPLQEQAPSCCFVPTFSYNKGSV